MLQAVVPKTLLYYCHAGCVNLTSRILVAFTAEMQAAAAVLWPEQAHKCRVVPQGVPRLALGAGATLQSLLPIGALAKRGFLCHTAPSPAMSDTADCFLLPAGLRPVKDVLFLGLAQA